MRNLPAVFISLLLFLPAYAAADTIIHMTANGFEPASVTIKGSDRIIVFKNEDTEAHWPASNIHPTHHLYPGSGIEKCNTPDEKTIFDACRPIQPGGSYVFTMNVAGDWTYHDHEHPEFTGDIVIVGTSTVARQKSSESLWSRFKNSIALSYSRLVYAIDSQKLQVCMRRK